MVILSICHFNQEFLNSSDIYATSKRATCNAVQISTGENVLTAAVKEVSDGKKDYCECYKGDFVDIMNDERKINF